MKRSCSFLLLIACILLMASSCFGGRGQQRSLPLGCTETITDNISYMVINNIAENRFEVEFIVENSANASFSVSIGSHIPEVPGWESHYDAEPPVSITDSNGMEIEFLGEPYRFNKSMTFYISYKDSPEKLKEFFSQNEGYQYLFSLYINGLLIGDGYYAPIESETNTGS